MPASSSSVLGLSELTRDDFDVIRPWIDPAVFRVFHAPVDDEQLEQLLPAFESGRPVSLGYRIVRESPGDVVGFIHATVVWKHMYAHLGQIVVDPSLRGKGIGTAALELFLPVCFSDLGLHRVQLFVDEGNTSAIECYLKAGFLMEGLMREAVRVDGGYLSWHCMAILESEWRDA